MPNVVSLRPPAYRRHKPSGQAVVTFAGRDHYLGKYNSAASKEQYRRLIAEYLLNGNVSASATVEITVAEVMARYIRFAKAYYRKNGAITREVGLVIEACRFVRRLYGRSPAVAFGPQALKAVRESMIEADHSRKYINKNVDRIRRMFRWAAAEELIPASVPQALAMVAGLRHGRTDARETPPVLPVADEVVEATLPHLPPIVADMVKLQRLCGARPSEICQLRPCDVDRSGDVWQYSPESHKTEHFGKRRVIFIGPQGQAILRPYLDRDEQAYCFSPSDSEANRQQARHAARRTPLSCGNKPGSNRKQSPRRTAGGQYTPDSYRRAIHRACDSAFRHPKLGSVPRAKLTSNQLAELRQWQSDHRWAPNQLRHAAATLVRKKFGLESAQVHLGHANASITEVYAERDMEKGREVARQIG